jgi:hypothetical protein
VASASWTAMRSGGNKACAAATSARGRTSSLSPGRAPAPQAGRPWPRCLLLRLAEGLLQRGDLLPQLLAVEGEGRPPFLGLRQPLPRGREGLLRRLRRGPGLRQHPPLLLRLAESLLQRGDLLPQFLALEGEAAATLSASPARPRGPPAPPAPRPRPSPTPAAPPPPRREPSPAWRPAAAVPRARGRGRPHDPRPPPALPART